MLNSLGHLGEGCGVSGAIDFSSHSVLPVGDRLSVAHYATLIAQMLGGCYQTVQAKVNSTTRAALRLGTIRLAYNAIDGNVEEWGESGNASDSEP